MQFFLLTQIISKLVQRFGCSTPALTCPVDLVSVRVSVVDEKNLRDKVTFIHCVDNLGHVAVSGILPLYSKRTYTATQHSRKVFSAIT